MSNITSDLSHLNFCEKELDVKRQQTNYKIKYVSNYLMRWAIISAERKDVTDTNFLVLYIFQKSKRYYKNISSDFNLIFWTPW